MRFGPRNAYYLRISANTVLPLYLYLDERHVDWMSERVLQHVLEDLRPRILPKLKEEADAHLGPGGPVNAKRGSVDVYRGDTYQFGYFLRNTDPHAVLIKARQFVAKPDPPKEKAPSGSSPQKRKQRQKDDVALSSKKRKAKGKQKATKETEEEEEAISISSDEGGAVLESRSTSIGLRRSTRARKLVAGGYQEQDEERNDTDALETGDVNADIETTGPDVDVAMRATQPVDSASLDDRILLVMQDMGDVPQVAVKHEDEEPELSEPRSMGVPLPEDSQEHIVGEVSASGPDLDPTLEEEKEDKSKLSLQLNYQGFNIHGRCLCIIVEPYPPIRSVSRAPSLAPIGLVAPSAPRAPSIAPADFVPSGSTLRARTPLFLPEYDRERSVTPFPRHRNLPPVPLFNEGALEGDSDSDDGGMLEFSQILKSVGKNQAVTVEDDDEIDGAVFFGDADETREL
ncbi:hypothetical protein AcV5_000684 [Taiwanofungus camphoratus]|nr:hypothetical protein AcW2_006687 [Antrodia cinnamomea]KAI0939199.1 hypothetical protein AcV5_000684 [Antrodia cinnamomea]KAI0952124.1 hypothetical protein AcV7_008026 [Antrodia cinnamomea]